MIYPQISDDYAQLVQPSLLERAAQTALDQQGITADPDITIVITGNEEIRTLNKEYLDNDAPTDVLSFPSDELDLDTGNRYLGDIIIAYPQAEAQAQAGGHALSNEIELLVVHGVLHLLGYDHAEEELKKEMWNTQAEILRQLNNPLAVSYT
jgi:probable rRNA maturation factor